MLTDLAYSSTWRERENPTSAGLKKNPGKRFKTLRLLKCVTNEFLGKKKKLLKSLMTWAGQKPNFRQDLPSLWHWQTGLLIKVIFKKTQENNIKKQQQPLLTHKWPITLIASKAQV